MSAPNGFTLLESPSLLATKRFTFDALTRTVKAIPYGDAKTFTATEVTFDGIEDLFEKLCHLQGRPRAFIVRGAPLPGANLERLRRLLYPQTGPDGKVTDPATFTACDRILLNNDIDWSPAPAGIDPTLDPDGALDFLLAALPEGCRDADVICSWGSSAGIPGKDKLSAHLIQLLEAPVPDQDLSRWAKAHREAASLDPAVFRPVQPYYTAAPIFDPGVVDPFAPPRQRIFLRRGSQRTVRLVIPEERGAPPASSAAGLHGCSGFDAHVARIGSVDGFNEPILAAIGAYVREHGARGTDVDALVSVLQEAILEADPGGRDAVTIARYASRGFLASKVDFAVRRDSVPKGRSFGVGPFEVQDGRIVYMKETKEGAVPVTLTNFVATITEERRIDDGAEDKHVFLLTGTLDDGTPLTPTEVPAPSFPGLGWVAPAWGSRPLIVAGQSARDLVREAIQRFSLSQPPTRRTVYQHTGWKKLPDGNWGFLHAGGAITASGNRDDVDVRLEDLGGLAAVDLPAPPEGDELRAAVRTSLDEILSLAPLQLTVPLLGAIYRAPLVELAEMPEVLLYVGKTGTGKSELAARGQQHFGRRFHAKALPAGWHDTANSLERVLFAGKDSLVVVDDFAPAGTREEVARAHANLERIFRSVGNLNARGRMRPDGTLRARYRPRGVAISTAEDVPRMHSARARALILEVEPGDVDFAKLSQAQRSGEEGVFSQAMAGYLAHLASQLDTLRPYIRRRGDELRANAYTVANAHRRTPEAVAGFFLGVETFLRFAVDAGALSASESEDVGGKAWEALLDAGRAQSTALLDADPVNRFDRLLGALFASGRAHVLDSRSGAEPASSTELGWTRTGAQGRSIGWAEAWSAGPSGLLLEPEATFALVQTLATEQGEPITMSKAVLWKRLLEAGRLLGRDEPHMTVRRQGLPGAGARLRVLHLAWPPPAPAGAEGAEVAA